MRRREYKPLSWETFETVEAFTRLVEGEIFGLLISQVASRSSLRPALRTMPFGAQFKYQLSTHTLHSYPYFLILKIISCTEVVEDHDNLEVLFLWSFKVDVADKTPLTIDLLNAPRLEG